LYTGLFVVRMPNDEHIITKHFFKGLAERRDLKANGKLCNT
jgi:hypothetical protein